MGVESDSVRAVLTGTGHFVPDCVVTNEDICRRLRGSLSPAAIERLTGIKERRFLQKEGVGASGLAVEAAKAALAMAGLDAGELDCILFATLSPDYMFPGAGVLLQEQLGAAKEGAPAFDLRNQCSGFVYALTMADSFVRSGSFEKILVVGAEVQSVFLDFEEQGRDLAVLFGDGAGAVVVEKRPAGGERGILYTDIGSDGRYHAALWFEVPGSRHIPGINRKGIDEGRAFARMDGALTLKWAKRRMAETIGRTLDGNGLTVADVDHFIFHQANIRIIGRVAKDLGIDAARCHSNIQRYGNLSAASIPALLDEVHRAGKLREGDLLLLVSFGSGFAWGSVLIRW
jgi:3-oxoacyl-[acyl-carrier-protein] synthase-3